MKINKYTFDNGKYEVHSADDGSSLTAYRYGEFWQNMIGDNLTAAMLHRIDELEFLLKEALPWLDRYEDCHGTPEEVTLLARIIEGKLK